MARPASVMLTFVVLCFVQRGHSLGGIEERLARLRDNRKSEENVEQEDFNGNLDRLVAILKTNGFKSACEAGKVARTWCQYKELLELNTAYLQQLKSVKKKSACWPGLPWPCDKRLARAVHNDEEFDYESANNVGADNVYEKFSEGKDFDAAYDTTEDSDADSYGEMENDDDKRALKCRPGMINCRGRKKKNGKRTIVKAPPKAKDCPQGWMYCL